MNRDMSILSKMRTIDIKGKPYVTVPSRIEAFWSMCPDGQIITEQTVDEPDRCAFICRIYDDKDRLICVGHASEVKDSAINRTSMVENCETSAIGRALGIAGIGSLDSIASAEEVLMAQAAQTPARGSVSLSKAVSSDSPTKEASARGFAHMKALLDRCRQAGMDMQLVGSCVTEATGKKSTEFGVAEYAKACDVLEGLLKEADNG